MKRLARSAPRAALALFAGASGSLVHAAADDRAPSPHRLDAIVVVGSRAAEPLRQVAATVSVVDRETIEREGMQDLGDLARRIPGLEAVGDAARFGLQGFNLRGLEGNRVSMEIDGVPLPDTFGVGQFSLAGRDLLELDALQQVEVLRGPASTLYGSKALAGVVAFTTRTPEDVLWRGAPSAGSLRLGASSRDRSVLGAAMLAHQSDDARWSGFVGLAQRALQHTENHPRDGGMHANPARGHRGHMLAKLTFAPEAGTRWNLTADHAAGQRSTEVESLHFAPGRYATTYDLDADDRWRRDRVSLDVRWRTPFAGIEEIAALLYHQQSGTRQDTLQDRLPDRPGGNPTRRERRFDFSQDSSGFEAVAQARGEWLGKAHWQVFGLDLTRHTYRSQRDGLQRDLVTGDSTPVVLGEVFPVRDFPRSQVEEVGLFWQDEIRLAPRWAVIPGLRWERYTLHPRNDAVWQADNPGIDLARVSSAQWTPKLGLRFDLAAQLSLYLQAVRGYRAPPFSDVNIGVYLPTLNYEVRSNAALQPERSLGFEGGLRWSRATLDLSLALYANRYRDLIDSRASLGIDPVTGAQVFQSVNRARARIRGLELDAHWRPIWGERDAVHWSLEMQASAARGDHTERKVPLDTILPARASLGLRLGANDARWGSVLRLTGVRRVRRTDPDAGERFLPPGHALVDLSAWIALGEHGELQFTVANLSDRRVWDWGNVRGVAPDAPDLDLYTRPGRTLSAQWRVEW